jgi:hypothetical protein
LGKTSFTDPTTNFYAVTGVVQNNGTINAGNWWTVEATFYNSSGSVVGWGASNYLTPASFPPNQTASFTVEPRDITTGLNSQITSYSLMIQNVPQPGGSSSPSPSTTPTPTSSTSPSSSPTSTSSSSTQPTSSPASQTSFPTSLLIALVVVIIVLVVAVVALLMRKRSSTKPT